MIIAYFPDTDYYSIVINQSNLERLKEAAWIDLTSPTDEEHNWVETTLDMMIPSRAAMSEIEISSRLFSMQENLYMTATMVATSMTMLPKDDAVTFILSQKRLITLRYMEPTAFSLFLNDMLPNMKDIICPPVLIFLRLLGMAVDHLADSLEHVVLQLDDYSTRIFSPALSLPYSPGLNYTKLMQEIGVSANLSGKSKESLLSLNRLISFFTQTTEIHLEHSTIMHLQTLNKDILSLSDFANFITTKIKFLLDATLGMVNIEQNNIIKIFSVAAVIFLPPTLIASIYGMNFLGMPELQWKYGYVVAIIMMLVSAYIPYKFFKLRRWL